MDTAAAPSCYRHPERETHIRCQRCERPICPDCMNQAAVGFQCPSCVAEGARSTRSGRTTYGGARSTDPARTSKVLIGINVLLWLLILATGGRGSIWVDRLALLPEGGDVRLPNGSVIVFPDGVADGAWWQLVTSMFTHVDAVHIGFNMLALWILGPQLEAAVGRVRFLALYFLSGLMGSLFVYWLAFSHSFTVGASGAIFGLMGALLVIAVKVRADYTQILVWLGLNVVITVVGSEVISWQGHLGGLVGGGLIALLLAYSPRVHRGRWQAAGLGALALVILAGVVLRTAVLA
jgi:membrane associated rhomboid family serine protease